MHFLGAVIAEKQDDIYGILAEWSEYADVDEYVKETRSEIIANGRADDQAYLEDHGNDTDPMHEKFKKAAGGRLALDDEAVGCGLPACRTTVNLMPASMPKLPGLCVLACAVSILAADGRIPSAERLEDTIILGDVNEDGTIPPVDADLTDLAAYAARRLEIRRIIIPSANLAGTTIPAGVEVIGLGRIDELLNQ